MKLLPLLIASLCLQANAQELSHLMRLEQGDKLARQYKYAEALNAMDGVEKHLDAKTFANQFYNLACVYSVSGRIDEAIDTLERCMPFGPVSIDHLKRDTDLDNLRGDPRFNKLIEKLAEEAEAHRNFVEGPFKNEDWLPSYSENLSDQDKLYGLSKIWSEARYNFAWFEQVPDLDWDKCYHEAIPKVLATKSTDDYYWELKRFMAALGDGHSNVNFPRGMTEKMGTLPISAALLEEKIILTEVRHSILSDAGITRGAQWLEIDGKTMQQALAEVAPFVEASSTQHFNRTALRLLTLGPKDKTSQLKFLTVAGKEVSLTVPRNLSWDPAHWQRSHFEITEDGIGLLTLNTFGDDRVIDDVKQYMPQILTTKALIIDVRKNGGGSTPNWLLEAICEEFPRSAWSTRAYAPTYRIWNSPHPKVGGGGGIQESSGYVYKAPIAVLIAAGSFSAAEDFAASFKTSGRGKLYGQPTGGTTGQPLYFELPGGGSARICAKRDVMSDGTSFVGPGVLPHIEVPLTIQDLISETDATLNKALADLRQQIK